MVGYVRAWLELDMRGEVIIICFALWMLSLVPQVGAHALGFDSIAALLGRLFLRPVSSIVTIVLIEPPRNSSCLTVGLPSCATRTLDSQL